MNFLIIIIAYDAAEIRIYSSLGNDYVNLSGSQQNIEIEWSPGNDTFIQDLNEEKYWQVLNLLLIGRTMNLYEIRRFKSKWTNF